jgi:hypothetical protein
MIQATTKFSLSLSLSLATTFFLIWRDLNQALRVVFKVIGFDSKTDYQKSKCFEELFYNKG